MSSLEELMKLAKNSQCACKVCALLRQALMAQMYQEVVKLQNQIKSMKVVEDT